MAQFESVVSQWTSCEAINQAVWGGGGGEGSGGSGTESEREEGGVVITHNSIKLITLCENFKFLILPFA